MFTSVVNASFTSVANEVLTSAAALLIFSSMESTLSELVWRGIQDANPWWQTGTVPVVRTSSFRRPVFQTIFATLINADRGRGVVLLGPRRVGKTVITHQIIEELLHRGYSPDSICFLALDDVALRRQDIGELLQLLEARKPRKDNVRILLLDEIQHAKDWSGWLKRLTDRKDPYVFFATGSSATALRHGSQDAGLGRWREITIFPWSFREHVKFKNLQEWSFEFYDNLVNEESLKHLGVPPPNEAERLEQALCNYFLIGGFPEVNQTLDIAESHKRLRQDILDRALGRDISDVVDVDPVILERLFLRVCQNPGGLWVETAIAQELGISRPTVSKYSHLLEEAFLIFRLPNLASPIKGLQKMYLVAPSLRAAMLSLDEKAMADPNEWGPLTENAIASAAKGASTNSRIGFWKRDKYECDMIIPTSNHMFYIESKRGSQYAEKGIAEAVADLKAPGTGYILGRSPYVETFQYAPPLQQGFKMPAALWLYIQSSLVTP